MCGGQVGKKRQMGKALARDGKGFDDDDDDDR